MDQPDVTETTRLQELYARRVAAREGGAGSTCVTPEAILAVVRREGPEAERLATLDHVMNCAACHREYEWLNAVDEAGLEATAAAGAGPRRVWWRGAPLALAASVAAAAGLGLMLSGVLRTAADRERGTGGDIVLVTPGVRPADDGPLTFTWHASPGVSRYVLEVQRLDGGVAFADTTADTLITLAQPSAHLPDQDYRWWVRELTDGTEPRSSELRPLRLRGR